ncbi:MAG: dienelactone hydrolase family protein [Acidimicrobiia bacterium]|nr:dienelactone hydrolase family protein [Acidimicrobiia bacterium]
MTVLKGEGKHPMLYGSYRLPVGRDLRAYIARPDISGSFPTVLVVHGAWGLTSHVKAFCRKLARYGFATLCPDLYHGSLDGRLDDRAEAEDRWTGIPDGRAARDVVEAFHNVEAPGTEWCDPRRIGILAIAEGGRPALAAAARIDTLAAITLVYAPVDAPGLERAGVPVLGIYATEDERVPADDVRAAREASGKGSFAFYGGVGHDFMDEARDGYDGPSADDAYERIIGFFEERLGAPVGA